MNHILTIKNIRKGYTGHQALSGVSLDIPERCIYGLLGPNGAGKTTLIRIITQIIEADSGSIYLDGKPLHPDHTELIGYLPEERGLYKKMKVKDQLSYLAQLKGMSGTEANREINQWLEKLDMGSWKENRIADLSKGMQQKIQFVAAVIHNPPIVILDEPFSGFDPVNTEVIKHEIMQLKQRGTSIIYSTHQMESAEELCDHITLINKGKKVMDGLKADIMKLNSRNNFVVKHKGTLADVENKHRIISQEKTNGVYTSVIETPLSSNELLNELIKETEVTSVNQEMASMREIFMNAVKERTHEKDTANS